MNAKITAVSGHSGANATAADFIILFYFFLLTSPRRFKGEEAPGPGEGRTRGSPSRAGGNRNGAERSRRSPRDPAQENN